MLTDKEKIELSKLRLEHSFTDLEAAKDLLKTNKYNAAANRAYYSVFHAIRSLLALDGIDRKHHSLIIGEFRRLYIKTGKLEIKLSDIVSNLFDVRNDSDYDDFYFVKKDEVIEQINNAEYFINKIKDYLKPLINP
jgi:uncharacterized protein (UPF0332 family)